MKKLAVLLWFVNSFALGKSLPVVLVHGAHFTAESFSELLKQTEVKQFIPVDFGRSQNRDPRSLTLSDYAQKVCETLQGLPDGAVLAGHSQGGAVVNQAFGLCPEKVRGFIYIAATIPFPGEEPFALFDAGDDEYYPKAIRANDETGLFEIFDEAKFLEGFAPDASEAQAEFVLRSAVDEPISPSTSLLSFDLHGFQELPKLVVHTTQDRIITPSTQKKYFARLTKALEVSLPTGHLPMVVAPEALYHVIAEFVREVPVP